MLMAQHAVMNQPRRYEWHDQPEPQAAQLAGAIVKQRLYHT